jgi:hypothetical protein
MRAVAEGSHLQRFAHARTPVIAAQCVIGDVVRVQHGRCRPGRAAAAVAVAERAWVRARRVVGAPARRRVLRHVQRRQRKRMRLGGACGGARQQQQRRALQRGRHARPAGCALLAPHTR